MIPTYVLTNDNHVWLMRGFLYLWQKYCGQNIVVRYGTKSFPASANIQWESSGFQYPASRWSDSLIDLIDSAGDKYFVLMLEDYWLYDYVDYSRINQLTDLMSDDILRIDLSGNRASYSQAVKIQLGIVETPPGTPYQMSFQAAIWHKENLRNTLRKGESPWESEIKGSKRVGDLRVLGTNPAMMKYQPVWRGQRRQWQVDKLKTVDLEFMMGKGWLDAPN